ncbi:hypothetical protein XELAEV_18023504mg [Xenopus laevis]|uniref:Uncharacterized protein n=1 Tax=Xenopus laevis TaxID=8355 RepID=A0A974HPM6_XENLA|nr:hypothetical protein XELAEV_18023504mg [Xenopus laevis]
MNYCKVLCNVEAFSALFFYGLCFTCFHVAFIILFCSVCSFPSAFSLLFCLFHLNSFSSFLLLLPTNGAFHFTALSTFSF